MMRLDVEHVLAGAKQRMLTEGEHAPLVIVKTELPKPYWLPITSGWADDHDARMKALFLLGREFAQGTHVTAEKISSVFLVAEVWVSNNPQPESSVEEQPDRQECLSVLELHRKGKTLEQTMYLVDIIRQGGVVDLGPPRKMKEIQTLLLTSFFAGVGSAQMSDHRLLQHMQHLGDP